MAKTKWMLIKLFGHCDLEARNNGDEVLKDQQSANTHDNIVYEKVRIFSLDRKGASFILHLLDTERLPKYSITLETFYRLLHVVTFLHNL
jgi:hypothetical protein